MIAMSYRYFDKTIPFLGLLKPKTMKTFVYPTIMALCLLFSSCSQELMTFTVISNQNVPVQPTKKGTEVSAKSKTIAKAMNKLIAEAGGGYDAIMNGQIDVYSYYAVLWIIVKYEVTGTPVSLSEIKATMSDTDFQQWCLSNNVIKLTK